VLRWSEAFTWHELLGGGEISEMKAMALVALNNGLDLSMAR
jgi:hypothetical protein